MKQKKMKLSKRFESHEEGMSREGNVLTCFVNVDMQLKNLKVVLIMN